MIQRGSTFQGEKLRLARLFHGLSLEEVGQQIGATRQFIHQLETGAKVPTGETEGALLDVLDVSRTFLHTPVYNLVKEDQCHFRKRLTTPGALTQQALARGALVDMFVSKLGDVVELPAVNFPDFPVSDLYDAERAAELSRQHWGLGLASPVTSMMRVVENAGAVVTHFRGLSEPIDALSMHRPRPIIVRSSAKESLCRLRFDLAHECAHLVMHRGIETGDHQTEDEANRFASAFLLPRMGFVKEFPRARTLDWRAIFDLKLRWKVSARAIVRRAYDLELIDSAQYRRANIHLMKTGQAKVEKYDDILPLESPELFAAAVSALEDANPYAILAIAEDLGLSARLYRKVCGRQLPEVREGQTNVIRLPIRRKP